MSSQGTGRNFCGRTRRELFGRFADTPTRICTAHFPQPSTGRLVRWKDAFDFKAD